MSELVVSCKELPFGRIRFDSGDTKPGDLQVTSENDEAYSKTRTVLREDVHLPFVLRSPTRLSITFHTKVCLLST